MMIKKLGTAICGIGILLAIGIVGRDDYLMKVGNGMPYGLLILGCAVALALAGVGMVMMVKGKQNE